MEEIDGLKLAADIHTDCRYRADEGQRRAEQERRTWQRSKLRHYQTGPLLRICSSLSRKGRITYFKSVMSFKSNEGQ